MFWYTKVDLTLFGTWQKILVVASSVTFIRLGTMSYLNSNIVKFNEFQKSNALSAATKLSLLVTLIAVTILLVNYQGKWSIYITLLCLELFLYPLVELKFRANSNWRKLSTINTLVSVYFFVLILAGFEYQDIRVYLLRYFAFGAIGLYSIYFLKKNSMDVLSLYRDSKSYTLWVFGKQSRDIGYRLPLSMFLSEESFGKITPLFWIISLVKLLLSPWGNIVNNTYQELNEGNTKREYKLYLFRILFLSKLAFLFTCCFFLFFLKHFQLNIYNFEFVYFALASVEILLLVKVFFLVDKLTNKLSWIYILWFGCNIVMASMPDTVVELFLVLNAFIGVSIFLYAYGREYFNFRGGRIYW